MVGQEEEVKGKRSKRPRPTSPLALTMSTTTSNSSTSINTTSPYNSIQFACEEEEADHHQDYREDLVEEEEDMANCLILLAKGQNNKLPMAATSSSPEPSYRCKTCDKSFSSFQALGGHRASHKNADKLLSTATKDREKTNCRDDHHSDVVLSLQMSSTTGVASNGDNPNYNNNKKSSRVHECMICGAEFTSGQALGGHMRRHRPAVSPVGGLDTKRPRNLLSVDLNLPAPTEDQDRDDRDHQVESKFGFVPKEQVIVFSASSLVDCHY